MSVTDEELMCVAERLAHEGFGPKVIGDTLGISHFAARSIVARHKRNGYHNRTISMNVSRECYDTLYDAAIRRKTSVAGVATQLLETVTLDGLIDGVLDDGE